MPNSVFSYGNYGKGQNELHLHNEFCVKILVTVLSELQRKTEFNIFLVFVYSDYISIVY